jgi:peptidyl-prolyl cis-trans isomerase SurA
MSILSRRLPWMPLVLALATGAGACRQSAAPPAASGPDVWAVVDGREIHADDIDKAFRRQADPNAHLSVTEVTGAKLNLLDQMITQDILVAEAASLKLDVPAADLDQAFNDQKKGMPDDAFNQGLMTRNITVGDVRESLRRNLLAQKVIDHEVTAKVAVTDQDINDFFEANKAQFNFPEDTYHLTQIVVTAQKDSGINNRTGDDAATPQEAAAKVQMIMGRLKEGQPFSELAMDYSEEPASAPRGGDVGMVSASSLRQAPANLRDAVLKAQPGQVTVVAQEGGYTIVGLVAKFPAGQRTVTAPDVHDGIASTLKEQRLQLLQTAYLTALRSRAKVVNYEAQRIVDSVGKTSAPAPVLGK